MLVFSLASQSNQSHRATHAVVRDELTRMSRIPRNRAGALTMQVPYAPLLSPRATGNSGVSTSGLDSPSSGFVSVSFPEDSITPSPHIGQQARGWWPRVTTTWDYWFRRSKELKHKVKQLGWAGLASLVLCNTAWYMLGFLVLWLWLMRSPRGLGVAGASARVAEVLGVLYLGSQATKLPRIMGVLALAPGVDKLLALMQQHLALKTRARAFYVLLSACVLITLSSFGGAVVIWA